MDDRTKKERNIDKLVIYLKNNPNTNCAQAAKVMHKSPRTIYNWCKERNVGLPTASAARRPSPSYDFTAPRTSPTPRAQSQSHSSMDEVGKFLDNAERIETFKDRLIKDAKDRDPRRVESIDEYIARQEVDGEYAHRRAKDEMLKSIILPLGDYVAQRVIQYLEQSSKR